jgi:hypothetical protein
VDGDAVTKLTDIDEETPYASGPAHNSMVGGRVTEAWAAGAGSNTIHPAGRESGSVGAAPQRNVPDEVMSSATERGGGKGKWGPRRRKGCVGQMLDALSVRDFFVKAPRLKRRERSHRFLRSWMPVVVFVSNVVALGCVLSPPFIQMETEEMVRMGHTLRELR